MHYIGYLIFTLLVAFFVLLFYCITKIEAYKIKKHFEAETEKNMLYIQEIFKKFV